MLLQMHSQGYRLRNVSDAVKYVSYFLFLSTQVKGNLCSLVEEEWKRLNMSLCSLAQVNFGLKFKV